MTNSKVATNAGVVALNTDLSSAEFLQLLEESYYVEPVKGSMEYFQDKAESKWGVKLPAKVQKALNIQASKGCLDKSWESEPEAGEDNWFPEVDRSDWV